MVSHTHSAKATAMSVPPGASPRRLFIGCIACIVILLLIVCIIRTAAATRKHRCVKDMVVLVNSFKESLGRKRCIDSLTQTGSYGRIVVVSGDEDEDVLQKKDAYWLLKVKHNSIDFTGIIAAIEHSPLLQSHIGHFDTFFYTHDTTEYGAEAWRRIAKKDMGITQPLILTAPNMNMGIYKMTDLIHHRSSILEQKSSDHPTTEERQRLKQNAVANEGFLFRRLNCDKALCTYNVVCPHDTCRSIYPSGACRIQEFYPEIELTKFKANFIAKPSYALL